MDSHPERNAQESSPTIVFLHGFGADMSDLAGLVPAIRSEHSAAARWLFLNGPHRVPVGPGWEGRAWFPLRMADLERLQRASGQGLDLAEQVPEGIGSARRQVLAALEAAGVAPQSMFLGGFSQGAMLATEVALRSSVSALGLIVLSGTLVNAPAWRQLADTARQAGRKVAVFQSHGLADGVLGIDASRRLREEIFGLAEWSVESVEFRGGHEIPLEVLSLLRRFISQRSQNL